jgi:hypothetical protein
MARTEASLRTNSKATAERDRSDLRTRIIEAHYLRQAIAREEALRRDRHDLCLRAARRSHRVEAEDCGWRK